MKQFLFLYAFVCSISVMSQTINLKNYQKSSGDNGFKNALEFIRKEYSAKKKHVVLFIPSGTYLLTEPVIINKYISLEGEFGASTILKVSNLKQEAIIVEDNKSEGDIHNAYNTIKNLTIIGPDFGKNPFAYKDNTRNNSRSVGIKTLGLRNRIENCIIDGFLWSGIEASSSYANFITNSFIKNNRIGIMLNNISTTAYINNNEIRFNSTAILIEDNSFGNFINNNIIENNINTMLEVETDANFLKTVTKGNGIIISNSMNNFIQNNYFEQQYNNITLNNARDNEFSHNFFALGNVDNTEQNVIKITGAAARNTFNNNQTAGSTAEIDALKIKIAPGVNYSTNKIDFGKQKNEQLRKNLGKSRNSGNFPEIPE